MTQLLTETSVKSTAILAAENTLLLMLLLALLPVKLPSFSTNA
jgi:hypothetical protein